MTNHEAESLGLPRHYGHVSDLGVVRVTNAGASERFDNLVRRYQCHGDGKCKAQAALTIVDLTLHSDDCESSVTSAPLVPCADQYCRTATAYVQLTLTNFHGVYAEASRQHIVNISG